MKGKLRLLLCMVVVMTMAFGLHVSAAEQQVNITVCQIEGDQVVLGVGGPIVPSDDGNYYLFALQPYEAGIGARTDYCDVQLKAEGVIYRTALNLNTPASKLYCRFQVAVLRGGQYVPVSNEYYITNPEVVATNTTDIPMGPKKGLTLDWQYASDLSATGSGYASYEVDISRFFVGGGTPYTYNGKKYEFNSSVVFEYDAVVGMCRDNNVHTTPR